MKLDKARSGLTLIRNYRLVCSESEARILTVRYLSRPKVRTKKGCTYLEYKPGFMPMPHGQFLRLTVS